VSDVTPRVVLLCGGQGMRVREASGQRPKALVEIGDYPILWHILRIYQRHGFNRFVICLGYRGDLIKEYFLNFEHMHNDVTVDMAGRTARVSLHPSHEKWSGLADRWEVTLAETGADSMTGARIKRIERYIDTDVFFCTYGDAVANVDLPALLAFHRAHGKLATVTGVRPLSQFGTMVTENDRVVSFTEKPELPDLVSGGFFVFSRGVLDYLSGDASCILETGPFQELVRDGQMMTFRHTGYWQCLDTPRDVQQLTDLWQEGERSGQPPPWLR
jgi:glucose-1-phosphate cytidylyltransferase